MTIATDRTGENIAFGVTVPIITPATKKIDAINYCETIAQKLTDKLAEDTSDDSVSIPVPVNTTGADTYFELQDTALWAAMHMARSLHACGFTVVSCTPAAMSGDGNESVSTGYMLVATRTANLAQLLEEQESYPVPTLWTSYARHTYGEAAINAVMSDMREQLSAAMTSNETKH